MKFKIGQTVYYKVPADHLCDGVIDEIRPYSEGYRYHIAGGIWRFEEELEPSLEALVERLLRKLGQDYRRDMERIIKQAQGFSPGFELTHSVNT